MIQLAKIFQSGMVVQREKPLMVWGTAEPKAVIFVSIQGKTAEVSADHNGKWYATMPPLTASDWETLTVSAGDEKIELRDVAVGEVWIAAGQSNMEFWMRYEKHLREERGTLPARRLRFFDVPKLAYSGQDQDFDYSRMGRWRDATAEDIEYFSAVGYYFQKELSAQLNVPVGIIGCNWGGTSSCAWMSAESAKRDVRLIWEQRMAPFDGIDMEAYRLANRSSPANPQILPIVIAMLIPFVVGFLLAFFI